MPATRHVLARQIGIYTFVLLITVLLVGSWVLVFFGISVAIVQIAGGAVVAHLGWTLLNQPSDSGAPVPPRSDKQAQDMAFFPLTMPITAGPGCIAVTLPVGAREVAETTGETLLGEAGAAVGILLVALSVFFCYRYADIILSYLGSTGKQVIVNLAAFINLCIGLQMVWHGMQGL